MKTLSTMVLALTVMVSWAWAQEVIFPVRASDQDVQQVASVTGRVDSVSAADPAHGLRSEIILVADNAKRYVFVVKATTTIYDASWKAITLDMLKKNNTVKIKYITSPEGLLETLSIRLLK